MRWSGIVCFLMSLAMRGLPMELAWFDALGSELWGEVGGLFPFFLPQ